MVHSRELIEMAKNYGFEHVAVIETSAIRFHEEVRKACERNVCGKYDTNWMGPPAIGIVSDLKKQVLHYPKGLFLQTVHRLQRQFDSKGMFAAAEAHQSLFRTFWKKVKNTHPDLRLLPLDVGCCSICEKCAYQDQEPCRYPDQAVSSVEAYGMDVATLMKAADIPCSRGKESVGFIGLILFDNQAK